MQRSTPEQRDGLTASRVWHSQILRLPGAGIEADVVTSERFHQHQITPSIS
ncbi:MAG: hypothetical protein ACK5QX_00680 [bacterium]